MKKNENKSIISTLFTEKELAELNFTEEEIAAIEDAEIMSQALDVLPDSEEGMDKFFDKINATFPPSPDAVGTFNKYMDLTKTDPKFVEQMVATSALLDMVEEVPPAKTEAISLDEIKKEQNAQAEDAKSAKIAQIDAVLAKMAKGNK